MNKKNDKKDLARVSARVVGLSTEVLSFYLIPQLDTRPACGWGMPVQDSIKA